MVCAFEPSIRCHSRVCFPQSVENGVRGGCSPRWFALSVACWAWESRHEFPRSGDRDHAHAILPLRDLHGGRSPRPVQLKVDDGLGRGRTAGAVYGVLTPCGRSVSGWGRIWGLSVGNVIHRDDGGVEARRPQCVYVVWVTVRWRRSFGWSASFPRRGQVVAGVGGNLGKNGGHCGGRSYPGCAQKLSTGCGIRAWRRARADDEGDGARSAVLDAEKPGCSGDLAVDAGLRNADRHGEGGVCEGIPSLWITASKGPSPVDGGVGRSGVRRRSAAGSPRAVPSSAR